MAERTPEPWEVAYPWDDNSGRYQHKTWVVHRMICDPSDCANFGDCDNPCFEWDVVLAEDLEAVGAPSDAVMEANARFIAAAPDLLEVAEKLEILMEKHGQLHAADQCGLCAEYMDVLHSAIAKAKGVDPEGDADCALAVTL